MNLTARANRLSVMLPVMSLVLLACAPAGQDHQAKGMEQYANDKDFHQAHTLRQPSGVPLRGKDIDIKVGDRTAKAYWIAPKEGQGQAVLMIHEWWGLNANIRETADKLNGEAGYGVLAVDLYEGKVATNADDAGKYMAAVDNQKAAATVNAALGVLKSGVDGGRPATKIGTIGYCFGGGWSHKAAIMGGDSVQACVIYYGMPTTAPGELERLKAPVLMVWGRKDKWINEKVVEGFESAMKTAGRSLEVHGYDADHAFANPSSQSYADKDAQEAWKTTIAFFKKNLE